MARATMQNNEASVIIPSVNSYADLEGCLNGLKNQGGVSLEIIVVDRLGKDLVASVGHDSPDVVVISVPSDTPIPQMRAIGIRRASAPAIAVIEDHIIVPADWARSMLDALADGHDVVAGSVENAATETLTDWAAFLCEYSSVFHQVSP